MGKSAQMIEGKGDGGAPLRKRVRKLLKVKGLEIEGRFLRQVEAGKGVTRIARKRKAAKMDERAERDAVGQFRWTVEAKFIQYSSMPFLDCQ